MEQFDWSDLNNLIQGEVPLREISRVKGCSLASVRKAIKRYNIIYTSSHNSQRASMYAKKAKPRRGEKSLIKCGYCGVAFERLDCTLNSKKHFCSASCRSKYIGNKLSNDIDYKKKMRLITLSNGNKPPLKKGKDHWNWKGGISELGQRNDGEYAKWRKSVISNSNFICKICGKRGGKLSAHHIKEWSKFPNLRYDPNNGECLCYNCHMEFHGLQKKVV